MEGIILAIAIIFPFLAGFICLGLKNSKARASLIIFTSIILIGLSILFLRHVAPSRHQVFAIHRYFLPVDQNP
jgi:hypothetical protein